MGQRSTDSQATPFGHGKRRERLSTNRQRVQLELSPDASAQLRAMREMAGVKTTADATRNALRLLDWFLQRRREGWRLQLVRGEVVREVDVIV
jgi:hypothetical protein